MKKSNPKSWKFCRLTILTLALLLCLVGCSTGEKQKYNDNDVVTTVAIFSDVHIGKMNTKPEEKFTNALQQLPIIAPKLDAIAFGGDITDRGMDEEYREFMNILNAHTNSSVKKIFCMGNHEYFRDGIVRYGGESKAFIEECQKAYQEITGTELDTVTVVNGVYVISVSAKNSAADYIECEKFLIKNVKAAAKKSPNMPIIIISHQGAGSFFEGGCNGYTHKTIQTLQKYPQIIFFSGHSHFALQDMRMIQQDAYTNVQTSTLGADFWNYSFAEEYQPEKADAASQGLILQVKADGTSEIIRYDFTNKQQIGQIWKVDPKNFTYDRTAKILAKQPVFPDDTELKIKFLKNKVVLEFPVASVNDDVSDGVIYSYKIRVNDKATGKVAFKASVLSDYYLGVAAKNMYSSTVSGLKPGTEYTASVTAVTIYDKHSEPVEFDFLVPSN